MKSIIVLGAGMVGSAMAIDLATDFRVTLADKNTENLNKAKSKCSELSTIELDVTNKSRLESAISLFDLVICAVPGFLGYNTLKSIIESGKDVVDISFFPENALDLDHLAKEHGVTAIVDCGVAPGMGNMLLGRYNELMNLTDFECLVGGLPKSRKWPFCYKAPFSPVDVIEEYTRPARYVENGEIITREALSDCELVEFEGVGTLESFNSDGLRSILFTMPHISNMKEKTLRYPGHVEYIQVLKQSGFFDHEEIAVNGKSVKPIDFTSSVLFKEWYLGEEDEELTVMRITMKGIEKSSGKPQTVIYDLHDTYCSETKTSSMARTTGYTATAVASMFLKGIFDLKGVFPPELIGCDKQVFDYVVSYLNARNIHYTRSSH